MFVALTDSRLLPGMFCNHNRNIYFRKMWSIDEVMQTTFSEWFLYHNKTVNVTAAKVLWQELHSCTAQRLHLWLVQYHVEETDVHLSDSWWTIKGVWEVMHRVLRCITSLCKQPAKDKRAFHCVAAAGAGEAFWKIMTNTTLSASQGEPVPSVWFMPLLDLHLLAD